MNVVLESKARHVSNVEFIMFRIKYFVIMYMNN